MGTLDDVNPTRLSKRSQGCPLTDPSHMTPEPVLVLQSDPAADQILLSNIWSYPYHSKNTLLPSSTLLLFRP